METDEADRIGLVNRVVDGDPPEAAEPLVGRGPLDLPDPTAFAKRLIDRAPGTPFEEELA